MTEKKARDALFELTRNYMLHPREERLKLYDDYIKKENEIKNELTKNIHNRLEKEANKGK